MSETFMPKFFQRIFVQDNRGTPRGNSHSLGPADYRHVLQFMPTIAECCALRSRDETNAATIIVERLGLPSHHDSQKNWDTLKCLYFILRYADAASAVLDAGASSHSVILNWLSQIGYTELFACDIRKPGERSLKRYEEKGINFNVQNLTGTDYPDNFFQIVTSISVIEHGVPLEPFCREQSRILRPGGLLLISTDYWSEYIDCSGIYPYGDDMGEMKVFQRSELEELCRTATRYDLLPCGELNLNTSERVVKWDRVNREYTFAFLALQKRCK